jgi:hypothetical protein
MTVRFRYANDYLTGGPANAAVTPSFKLKEYARPDGSIRIHRELVASIQVLRDTVGSALKVVSLVSGQGLGDGLDGRFAWLESVDSNLLAAAAAGLVKEGHFIRTELRGNRFYVEMPDPSALPPIRPETALTHALKVTAAFETSGDPFQQVTGNFDKAGLSFGPLQVNFRTGTLQDLFGRFAVRDEKALRACFGNLWTEWQQVMKLPSRAKQVAWADALSRGPNKAGFAEPWKSALQAVGREPAFQSETLRYAYDVYGRKLIVALSWLRGLNPMRITNLRCLAALYDLCVQQGSLDKAHDAIRRRVSKEQPRDQFHLTRIAVEERGRTASPEWRADCISRRLCILEREPVKVSESGKIAERENPRLYLLRNAPVNQVEEYLL